MVAAISEIAGSEKYTRNMQDVLSSIIELGAGTVSLEVVLAGGVTGRFCIFLSLEG